MKDGLADFGAQFIKALEIAEVLSEFVIQLREFLEPNLLQVDLEPDRLTGQLLGGVVLRIRNFGLA